MLIIIISDNPFNPLNPLLLNLTPSTAYCPILGVGGTMADNHKSYWLYFDTSPLSCMSTSFSCKEHVHKVIFKA